MFAVIHLPDFPLQALLRFQPALRHEPTAILSGEGRRAAVSHVGPMGSGDQPPGGAPGRCALPRDPDLCPPGRAGLSGPPGSEHQSPGVTPGMSAAQALAVCPALQLLAPSPDAEREADALLLTAARALSPTVEHTAPGCCTVDLTGTDDSRGAQFTSLRADLGACGLDARIGIGPTPFVARLAALQASPELQVTDTGEFLAPLPIGLLEPTPDEERLLGDLGLHTFGSLTALPRASLADRLGARGEELYARATGEHLRPLQPAPLPTRHLATRTFEDPVEVLEPLLFTLRRFCERLAAETGQLGGGTGRLALMLTLEDDSTHARDFDLPEPTADADRLFAVIETHLCSLHTESPVTGLTLEAFPARRLQLQEGLFDTGLCDAPLFFATLGRLAAVAGSGNVGTPRRADSHRPDAFVLDPPAAQVSILRPPASPAPHGPLLRRLRPPARATVELTDARPSYLASPVATGGITVLRRPFRSSGDWWSADAWTREEWDIRVGDGLYRLLHVPDGWFVEGTYD
jgi:protein ImuB